MVADGAWCMPAIGCSVISELLHLMDQGFCLLKEVTHGLSCWVSVNNIMKNTV